MTDKDTPQDQPVEPTPDGDATPSWAQAAAPPAQGPAPAPAPSPSGGPEGSANVLDADLGEVSALPPRPEAKRRPALVVAAVVGAGALLLGGVAVGRGLAGASDTAVLTSQNGAAPGGPVEPGVQAGAPSQQDGAPGRRGGGSRGMADGTRVVGQVTAVSGSTLTLTSRSGPLTVTTTSATTVDGTAGGDLSALAAGTLVLVEGASTGDGKWTATALRTAQAGRPGGQA